MARIQISVEVDTIICLSMTVLNYLTKRSSITTTWCPRVLYRHNYTL